MEISYWQSRWNKNKIGFHSPVVNSYLHQFESQLLEHAGKTVLVPLCGKTPDMLWLAEKGFNVIGIEVVRVACEAFFLENQLEYTVEKKGKFHCYNSGSIQVWCGSIFDFPRKEWKKVNWVYDRASVGALPPAMRKKYYDLLNEKAICGTNLMMHTFEYDEQVLQGPPFSVLKNEIQYHLKSDWEIEYWFDEEVLQKYQRFKTKGLISLKEQVYWMKKKTE
ncbi:thiopurine S-methyltransferase [bacterium]|nr:MAG: thiopurine S-methyltransferase [bacterium]